MSLEVALTLSMAIAGLAGVITGAEGFVGRSELSCNGLLNVKTIRTGRALIPRLAPPLRWAPAISLGYIGFSLAILISLVGNWGALRDMALLGLAACVVLQAGSMPYGRDGADEMSVVIVVPLAAVALLGQSSRALEIAFLFIACQLSLSYLAAGIAKACGRYWRDGSALLRIAQTFSYGEPRLARGLQRFPLIGRAATRAVVVWELLVPAAILVGGPAVVLVLSVGAFFHVANAWVMGLNRFLLWFLAAYPAALFVALRFGLWS